MILGSLFAYALHPYTWTPVPGSRDYRVTTTFYGVDLINGGIHRAVDTGNFRVGDPVYAPVDCKAHARIHFDGAIGVIFDLGKDWVLEAWHLEIAFLGQNPVSVTKGTLVGRTGASGRVFGGHTHIELKHRGIKVDPEPHLPMAERPARPIPMEDDMSVPAKLSALAAAALGAGNRIREAPSMSAPFTQLQEQATVQVFGIVPGEEWTVGTAKGSGWYWIGYGLDSGFVATALLPGVQLTALGKSTIPGGEDARPYIARLEAIRKAGGW